MAQDGKVEIREEEDGRRVFYVDVGDMSSKEALRVINEIRKKQGLSPVSRSWVNWVIVLLIILTATIGMVAVMPEILTLLPL